MDAPLSLVQAVEDSVREMSWLTAADQAAVAMAKAYAATIDEALDTDDVALITKALYLGPHLMGVLAVLGGTPAGRKALQLATGEAKGKLGTLRKKHLEVVQGGRSA